MWKKKNVEQDKVVVLPMGFMLFALLHRLVSIDLIEKAGGSLNKDTSRQPGK